MRNFYRANSVQYHERNPDVYTTSKKYKDLNQYQQEQEKQIFSNHQTFPHQETDERFRPSPEQLTEKFENKDFHQETKKPDSAFFHLDPPANFADFSFSPDHVTPETDHHHVKKSVQHHQYYHQPDQTYHNHQVLDRQDAFDFPSFSQESENSFKFFRSSNVENNHFFPHNAFGRF